MRTLHELFLTTSLFSLIAVAGALPACSSAGDITGPAVTTTPDGNTQTDGGTPPPPDQVDFGTDAVVTETTIPANYWPKGVDQGVVDPTLNFRALIVFQIRNQAALAATINTLYDLSSPQFRSYLSYDTWMARHAPADSDIAAVEQWLQAAGMKVERVAHNHLMLQYSGTVGQWNAAFGTQLHSILRQTGTWRNPTYAPITALQVPQPLVGKIKRLIMPDGALDNSTLSADNKPIQKTPPANVQSALTPAQLAKAYGLSDLYAQGFRGAGVKFGIIADTTFRLSDAQSMWQTFGITRNNPTLYDTMEPQQAHDLEPTLDVQLSGALAPEAELIFYSGPDNSDTSLLYTFNEAIGLAQVQVLSDSFAHSEATTSSSVARSYDESAMMAAALGITVVSASGDSNQVDTPSNSPYVTAVGGTNVTVDPDGTWRGEQSWDATGCGPSKLFTLPAFQQGVVTGTKGFRAVADVGVVEGPYWVMYQAAWVVVDGTSAASPVFAGLLAVVDQYRKAHGRPALGYLNPLLYQNSATRGAFRDIVVKGAGGCDVTTGYDMATGMGSPKAMEMATSIP